MHEIYSDVVILESHSDPRNSIATRKRKVKPHVLSSTTASRKEQVVANFNRRINNLLLARVNQTRVKLKGLETGNKNPKVDA